MSLDNQLPISVITHSDTVHLLHQFLIAHLKTQLAGKDEPAERGGTALWTGCGGAMDAAALDKLLAARAEKQRLEEEKAAKAEQSKVEGAEKTAASEKAKAE